MKDLTENNSRCCSGPADPDKPSTPIQDAPKKTDAGFSSSGVSLMPSMNDSTGVCCPGTSVSNPLASYEKPGYDICHFVDDFMDTSVGRVPVISAKLTTKDWISTFMVRCGINRYSYTVSPGVYAVGRPDATSEVLVTANFKLTLDHLRTELAHLNVWILVLDTKGINVWCAAGKGTFATAELVERVKQTRLDKLVSHHRLIVPQLGATGVSARDVKKQCGFKVVYGPVRASDLPEFLNNHRKADPAMRQVTFTLYERFILTPVEVQIAIKPALITTLVLFLLSGFGPGIFSFSALWERGWISVTAMGAGIVSGALITPVLLPYLPFRQFAAKGIISGSVIAVIVLIVMFIDSAGYQPGFSGLTALFLFSVTISSFLAMNFTGTTPFTSPTGVELEMKRFMPAQLAALVVSSGLWLYSAF